MMLGEIARDSGLTAQQEINAVMVEIVNRLKTKIEDYSIRLQDLTDQFSFILSLSSIDIKHEKEREKLMKDRLEFANYYDKDVTANQLYDDFIDFVMLFRARGNAVPSNPKHAFKCLLQFGRMSSQLYVLHIGYCSPSDFQLQAVKGHLQS